MLVALTREPGPRLVDCELTYLARAPIDVATARAQHARYERALAGLGCRVERLPPAPELPDAVFVEDTAVVLDEVAVITRPGAESRRPETRTVAEALATYRPLAFMTAPATLDGGDVLRIGRRLYVGISTRTNAAGAEQFRQIAAPFGYEVETVAVRDSLHLKTAASVVGASVLLLNPEWLEAKALGCTRVVEVDPAEPFAANALRIGETVVCAAEHVRTAARLRAAGFRVVEVPASELAKAEAGVTCCSLVFEA